MSTVERNKGTLVKVGTVKDIQGDMDTDTFYEFMELKGYLKIKGKIYSVDFDVESERDCDYFAEVREIGEGVFSFHTLHYNGSASLEEVLGGYLSEE